MYISLRKAIVPFTHIKNTDCFADKGEEGESGRYPDIPDTGAETA
jgi:hypothetical protein